MPGLVDSMLAQTVQPLRWVIVDDGSSDETVAIAAGIAAEVPWVTLHRRNDRGIRKLGGGVVEAVRDGIKQVGDLSYDFLAKVDADVRLPSRYFELLLAKFSADERLGTASGKPYLSLGGRRVAERVGDDFSAGQAKMYRREAFEAIGGLVAGLMWDTIDCHRCRQLGWSARSFRDEDLGYEHRRLMGSSDETIRKGRLRWGRGHYFMGTHPAYLAGVAVYRAFERPFVVGAAWIVAGYVAAWLRGDPQIDEDLRRWVRRWQLRQLGWRN